MGQIGGPGARPGPGLGAIGQHGGHQLGQIIGRDGHRRGRGRGAAAVFPQADSGGGADRAAGGLAHFPRPHALECSIFDAISFQRMQYV